MPELPDITVYVEALRRRVVGHRLERVRIAGPFLLRSVDPPVKDVEGRVVREVRRVGKRIAIELEDGVFVVLHLMIAGRLQWKKAGSKGGLAMLDFDDGAGRTEGSSAPSRARGHGGGTLVFTEAGSKHRASMHVSRSLDAFAPGGVDPLDCTAAEFAAALRSENHTLKRSLTSPHLVSGVGNAYSDEILHRARVSPVKLTARLTDDEIEQLHSAMCEVLSEFTERIRREVGDGWPAKVTAFREDFAVHGKFGKPCPVCGTTVQRIVKGENESNYCPRCQTDGKMLADRALSKLLHDDWPSTIEEWEAKKMPGGRPQGTRTARNETEPE